MKSRKLLVLITAALLLAGAAGCTTSSSEGSVPPAPTGSPPPAAGTGTEGRPDTSQYADVLKIGVIQDLTGGASGFGIPIWNYINMVADEINAAGGIDGKTKIEVVGYDTGSDATDAISVFNRLVSLDKVHAVIGSTISNEMIAVAPVAESLKIPTLSTSLDDKIVTNDDGSTRRYNFILQCSARQQGFSTAVYLAETVGVKELAVLYNEGNAFATSITRGLLECLENFYPEIKVNLQTCGNNETDYSTYLSKIVTPATEALYCGTQTESAEVISQIRKLGYTMPIYGPNTYYPFILEIGEYAEKDVYYMSGLDINAPEFAETNQKYREKFGEEIVAQSYQAADGLNMIIEAFRAGGGSTNPEVLVDNLMKVTIQGYQSPDYSFTSRCVPGGLTMYLARISDAAAGTQETVATIPVPNEKLDA